MAFQECILEVIFSTKDGKWQSLADSLPEMISIRQFAFLKVLQVLNYDFIRDANTTLITTRLEI